MPNQVPANQNNAEPRQDSWLARAIQRREDEGAVEPEARVAPFNSAL